MQIPILRIFMWVLGFSAVFGNIFVVVMRFTERPATTVSGIKQRLFIANLGVSDCFMGMYMLIIASADLYYGDDYFTHSEEWRTGPVCKVASFLALLSSEASVFIITLISVDRCLSISFPFSQVQLRSYSSKVTLILLWIMAVGLALVPTLLAGPESDFYDLSDVCVGLPLITRPTSYQIGVSNIGNELSDNTFDVPIPGDSKSAWYFSIGIFLVLNLICFVVIALCYAAIFVSVKKSAKNVQRQQNSNDEIKMATKMAAVVGTDFLCWFPVIIMGVLSQTGLVVVPLVMYVWSVVFILPINSSLNPFLYTLASAISDYRLKKKKKSLHRASSPEVKSISQNKTGSTKMLE